MNHYTEPLVSKVAQTAASPTFPQSVISSQQSCCMSRRCSIPSSVMPGTSATHSWARRGSSKPTLFRHWSPHSSHPDTNSPWSSCAPLDRAWIPETPWRET
eukprot:scaffold79819_cov17-Prasinocladus_malaysianus.AAC.1